MATRLLADIGCIGLRRHMTPEGEITYPWFSEALHRILGFQSDQMTVNAKGALNPIHWADRDDHLREILKSAASLHPCHESFRIIDAQGETRWLTGTSYPRQLPDGRVIWDGVWMDDTLLQRAQDQHEMLMDAAEDCIFILDGDGVITWANAAAANCFRQEADHLPGHPFGELVETPDLRPGSHELSARRPNGETFPFQMTVSEMRRDGKLNLIVIGRDITEATRIRQERRHLELLLLESQKLEALGRLAGGIAHELNNMLGPILMGAEMVARTAPLDQRNAERVQRIIDAAKNSRDIVRSILAYCRKEAKTLVPLDMVPLAQDFAAMAESVLPAAIKVVRHIRTDRAVIMGDSGQLRQVLLNLANNARDAMNGEGTLTLELSLPSDGELAALVADDGKTPINPLSDITPGYRYLLLRITDTGPGIPPQLAAKIFDPFFTTKPVGQGTGLGLSVVQGIIKGMAGSIAARSRPGEGATFDILLPLAE
ncbi:hypothetical protein A6A04_06650 [Paramagnetospirillum marisnigri]|uniref:histidine kinase n=1 Tax=Paramagnetospirillum marisnigri TaxID=1285242 RepID=A0A178MAJ1_9PROT|nr:hypothetical protein A6A04_06650 [Paramagnetospirillum marisnigri]